MSAHWAKVERGNGFVEIYAVDQHGCILNTEPACAIPAGYGAWFQAWLLAQPCPYDDTVYPLLEHLPMMLRADGKNEQHAAWEERRACPQCHTIDRVTSPDYGGVCVVCWRRNQGAQPGE